MNDIDILEELKPEKMDLIQLIRKFKREGIENFITIRREKFENLISENKELKEENEKLNEFMNNSILIKDKENRLVAVQITPESYIPKSKVEEKIKELEKQIEEMPNEINFSAFYRMKDLKNFEIGVLQSLLGKE